jgi:predicted phage tail component-like protein
MDYLGDKTFDELGLIFLRDYYHPIAPDTRDRSVEIPGRHGAYDFGADLSVRNISIPCAIKGDDRTALQQTVRALVKHLFDSNGKPKTMQLILDDEPDKMYMVRFSGGLPIERIVNIGKFTLPLTAFDPYAYHTVSTEEITMDSDASVMSEVLLDSVYSFNVTAPQTLEVHNFSYYRTYPTIEIIGAFTSLTLSANGKSFSFGQQTNKKIVVGEYTTTINGVNSLSAMTGDSLEFVEGFNDVVITGSNINVIITFKFKPKYL